MVIRLSVCLLSLRNAYKERFWEAGLAVGVMINYMLSLGEKRTGFIE